MQQPLALSNVPTIPLHTNSIQYHNHEYIQHHIQYQLDQYEHHCITSINTPAMTHLHKVASRCSFQCSPEDIHREHLNTILVDRSQSGPSRVTMGDLLAALPEINGITSSRKRVIMAHEIEWSHNTEKRPRSFMVHIFEEMSTGTDGRRGYRL